MKKHFTPMVCLSLISLVLSCGQQDGDEKKNFVGLPVIKSFFTLQPEIEKGKNGTIGWEFENAERKELLAENHVFIAGPVTEEEHKGYYSFMVLDDIKFKIILYNPNGSASEEVQIKALDIVDKP